MSDDLRHLSLWWDTLPASLREPLGAPLAGDEVADVAIVVAVLLIMTAQTRFRKIRTP